MGQCPFFLRGYHRVLISMLDLLRGLLEPNMYVYSFNYLIFQCYSDIFARGLALPYFSLDHMWREKSHHNKLNRYDYLIWVIAPKLGQQNAITLPRKLNKVLYSRTDQEGIFKNNLMLDHLLRFWVSKFSAPPPNPYDEKFDLYCLCFVIPPGRNGWYLGFTK